jgi:carboxypeptidase T
MVKMTKNKILSFGVLAFLLCSSLCISGSSTDVSSLFIKDLVRVDISQGNTLLPRGVEIVAENQGQSVDIIIPRYRLAELTAQHLSYSVIIADLDAYDMQMAGSYHTLAQMESILEGIADDYPDITSLFSIGTTYEGRSIWCLEISDNPGVDEGEPGVLFMGLHHAREWPTIEINLHIANNLTSLYGVDSTITNLVNNRRVWIIPCTNPDGYYYCHDQSHDWRKNRQYFPEFGTYGVDLNRNYPGSSNGDIWGAWGAIGSASVTHHSSEETYCGTGPTSELEIQAIRDFFINNDVTASISWHTYQEELYWPWGYTPSPVPDVTSISSVGTQIASKITRQSGSGTYTPQQACSLYPTTGDNIDWEYGYSHYVLGRATFPFTIEACSDFHPSASYLDQICKENCDGGIYLLSVADDIQDTIVPRVMPPILTNVPDDSDGNYQISWEEVNPSADPTAFQLDELTNLQVSTDDAESGSGLWTLDGFTLSTAKSHSASHSYKSHQGDADCSSLTTVDPLPITTGMKLSFWCWYNTENYYDYAFVEVSKDGRAYDLLDKFAGSSGGWVNKEYDLSSYAGSSLFIRFRYTTDQGTANEGFYVDDISPVPDFGTVTTLSDTITSSFYNITGKTNGTYYYRVNGYNDERGWCDFSTLEKVVVSLGGGENDTTPPVTSCSQNGTMNGDVYTSDVTVTLTATDNGSGVNTTMYKLDDGAWTLYAAPFLVFGNGAHTVSFYSDDNAGNVEDEQSTTFTIQYPVEITIKGGLGVSAEIKNTGTTTLSNISWTISLDGSLVFYGKTKTNVIPTLAPGESVTVKDFVIGFGRTGILVTTGTATENATGMVLLFFVLGVS